MHACNLSAGAQSLHSVRTVVTAQRSLLILMHNEAIGKHLKKQSRPVLTTSIENPIITSKEEVKVQRKVNSILWRGGLLSCSEERKMCFSGPNLCFSSYPKWTEVKFEFQYQTPVTGTAELICMFWHHTTKAGYEWGRPLPGSAPGSHTRALPSAWRGFLGQGQYWVRPQPDPKIS